MKKKYEKPEIELVKFSVLERLADSLDGNLSEVVDGEDDDV